MKHLILTGACYVDTILRYASAHETIHSTSANLFSSVPFFPGEDDKLRATSVQVRRGGNCPNSIEVLQQLLGSQGGSNVSTYLIACLPAHDAPATAMIGGSFGRSSPNLDLCIYRPGCTAPASSYILRSAATGSRTIVNHSDLPEMTADEFREVADRFFDAQSQSDGTTHSWWHFEGRIPDTTLACIQHLTSKRDDIRNDITISVEVEKPGREGLRELAALADVVFYSKTWAEVRQLISIFDELHGGHWLTYHFLQGQGYSSAEACLRGEATSLPRA